MFVQHQAPHTRPSQENTGRGCGAWILMLFVLLLFPRLAIAQNRDVLDQMVRPTSQPGSQPSDFKPMPPSDQIKLEDVLLNLHGSYSVSLMGPRLDGESNETYNIYLDDVAPIQLFHSFKIGYQVNPDLAISFSESAVQNLADNVVGLTGYVRGQSFSWYDLQVNFDLPNLIHVGGFNVFTSLAFSLPLTQLSQDAGKITAITIFQNWGINTYPSDWSLGSTLFFQPQFYSDPMPPGYTDRQTLALSFGPYVGYKISPELSMQFATNLSFEHRSPDERGGAHFGQGLPDTGQISMTLAPNLGRLFISLGGYFQWVLFTPSYQTSILGANFSIGF